VSAEDAMLSGRQAEEDLMVDRIRVYRVDATAPDPVMDEETGQYPDPTTSYKTVYEGRAQVLVRADINGNVYEAVVAEQEGTIRNSTIKVPVVADPEEGDQGSTAAILPDDACIILSSPMDPTREGRVLNLQAQSQDKTYALSRQLRGLEVLA
jgi:hypothetical protein